VSGRALLALLTVALATVALCPGSARADFGIASAAVSLEGPGDAPLLDAGAHPDLRIDVSFRTIVNGETGLLEPEGNPRSLEVRLPPGLIGNPRAVPTCPRADLAPERCAVETRVGTARLTVYGFGPEEMILPIFNLEPPPGVAGQLGLAMFGVPALVDVGIDRQAGDYSLIARISGLPQAVPVGGVELTLRGEPDPGGEPLITNPTECSGEPLGFAVRVDSWQRPGVFEEALIDRDPEGEPLRIGGCGELPFEAALSARPTGREADAPSGLELAIETPWRLRPRGSALLRDAVVALPEGMALNPAAAAGLVGCTPAQADLGGEDPARCPPQSRIGIARIVTPLLAEPLAGELHLAQPRANELGAPLTVYLTVDDPRNGTVLKLLGRVDPDPGTGRLTVGFEDLPRLPFERIELSLFGGERGVLTTPPACGRFDAAASLAPWSGAPPLAAVDSFAIGSGPGDSACPDGAFSPRLSAGSTDARAGVYSPFVLRLLRAPGEPAPRGLGVRLPRGLLARLDGIPYCADAVAPACPAASRVGSVHARLGAGPFPYPLDAGAAYLAGPYKGAPLSLALVVPARAGPFDLGTEVVRVALHVDPRSAAILAVTDPLPTILHGIPLGLRELRVLLDRPGFTRNPTSCARKRIAGAAVAATGARARLRQPFQVDGCRRLAFAPRLGLRLRGGTGRGSHPGLTATLRAGPGEASIRRLKVTLPRFLTLAQDHIRTVCTRVRFAADACPKGSVYGRAEVQTPLLGRPLRGPVLLRSSDNLLPDLVADLRGQIRLELVGRVVPSRRGFVVAFAGLPDAPMRKVVLRMRGGAGGLVAAGADLCRAPVRARVASDGHDGRVHDFFVRLRAGCRR